MGACHPNHHIYVLTIWLPIFIRGYRASSWGPLPFQTYLRWVHDLLPLVAYACIPPFEQFLERGVDCLWETFQRTCMITHFLTSFQIVIAFDWNLAQAHVWVLNYLLVHSPHLFGCTLTFSLQLYIIDWAFPILWFMVSLYAYVVNP
jgi:hypothetical protein